MILSDITKRVIKVDDLKDIINIFQKNNGKNNEVNIIVGEFEKELCCEIEIIYPVGDRFDKEDIKSTNFKKDKSIKELMESMSEELRECFETITKYKVNSEYFNFLGKVCTYYGYSLNDLEEKLIKKEDKLRFVD